MSTLSPSITRSPVFSSSVPRRSSSHPSPSSGLTRGFVPACTLLPQPSTSIAADARVRPEHDDGGEHDEEGKNFTSATNLSVIS
jgi:hypothetical protein